LGEGKLYGALENQIFYCLGCAHAKQGEHAVAEQWYRRASVGLTEPASALYYNDQPPEMLFYQGLALRKLGETAAAEEICQQLIDFGQSHLDDTIQADYFAVSLPEFAVFAPDLQWRNRVHCHFMLGLGYLGLGMKAEAMEEFDQVLHLCADHQGAAIHKRMIVHEFVED
jgi:tetratricopeptide (TPR) repeat protein